LIEFDNDESTDHQYSFNDVAFLARSFINYLERDVALIEDSGFAGTYSFSENESPYDVICNDLKEAAAKLVDVAERLSKLPIAVVDRPSEATAKPDEVQETQKS
jgi:hypothetical protein